MEHPDTRTRNRPWRRFGKKTPPPAVEPDRAAAEAPSLPDGVDDPFAGWFPEPGLRPEERKEAETEAQSGLPAANAAAPSDGELRLGKRFVNALAGLRKKGDEAYAALDRAHDQARHRARQIAAAARARRDRIRSLPELPPEGQAIDRRYLAARDAEAELEEFRREHGLSHHAAPRPAARGWWFWLVGVAFAETLGNGLLVHSGTTDGFAASWGFAALISVATVGGLGWLLSDLVFRRWRFAGIGKRLALAGGLAGCLVLFVATHFGFAHYRDAIVALADSGAGFDAGFDLYGLGPDGLDDPDFAGTPSPHPAAAPIGIGRAVLDELRAQFAFLGLSPPGWSVVTSHPSPSPDDHEGDTVMEIPPGQLGYEARDGALWRVRDERAGKFDEWQSFLLLGFGIAALILAVWKWYFRNEPLPDWERLHRAAQAARRDLDDEYRRALEGVERQETRHRAALDQAENSLDALPRRLHRLHERRRHLLRREAELLRETTQAATATVEDYRAANRARRSQYNPPPGFWESPWSPPQRSRDEAAIAGWQADHEKGLAEVRDVLRQVACENAAHAPAAEEAYRRQRARLAHAARRSAPPEEPAEIRPTPAPMERVPQGVSEGGASRLRAAS